MKPCIRPFNNCVHRIKSTNEPMCNILGRHYKCLDEESYMADVLEVKEQKKKFGEGRIIRLNEIVNELNSMAINCSSASAMDRFHDAIKELRKARLELMNHYGIDLQEWK